MLNIKTSYLYENNGPFFWLGDTAWLLFGRLKREEIIKYLDNRASLGFNVIQAILLFPSDSRNVRDYNDESYFDFVNDILLYAEALGIYFALLPCWGSSIKNNLINEDNYEEILNRITNKFKDNKNIIWVLGGDIRGDYNISLFNKMGKLIKKNNPDKLITFHPFGRLGSYLWFNDEDWLDFNMYQSGHRRYDQLDLPWNPDSLDEATFGEDAYRYVYKAKTYANFKPIIDGEPSYEGVVQGLHDSTQPYWQDYDVRRYAYYGIFAGASGFTYGHGAIIQFYTRGKGEYGVKTKWQDALDAPGAKELIHLKRLMESIDYVNGNSDDSLVLNQGLKYSHQAVFKGNDYILIYNYLGNKTILNLNDYKDKEMAIWLMNPINGILTHLSSIRGLNKITLMPPKREDVSNDWVIILKELK